MENVKLLSGIELVANGSKKGNINLPYKGLKQIVSEDPSLEIEQIENSLTIKKKLLKDQRIEKKNTLSVAEWNAHLQKAHVVEKRGPHWLHIGHVCGAQTFIFPEEALYLMEIGALLLKFGGVIVSIQQSYAILLGKSISLDEYRVYSLLSREGYKLIRHKNTKEFCRIVSTCNPNKSIKVIENCENSNDTFVNNLDKHFVCGNIFKIPDSDNKLIDQITHTKNSKCCTNLEIELYDNDIQIPEKSNNKRKSAADTSKLCGDVAKRKAYGPMNDLLIDVPLFNRLRILDSIVNCFQQKGVYVNAPNQIFLPHNLTLTKKQYFVKLENNDVSKYHNKIFSSNEFIEDHFSNSQTVLLSVQPYKSKYRFNNQCFNSLISGNNPNSDTPFYNHIFQQIIMKDMSYTVHSEKWKNFSNFNYVNHTENQSSYDLKTENIEVEHKALECNKTSKQILNNKYSQLLIKVKALLSKFNNDGFQTESQNHILSECINEYNLLFDSNYVLNNVSKNSENLLKYQDTIRVDSNSVDIDKFVLKQSTSQTNEIVCSDELFTFNKTYICTCNIDFNLIENFKKCDYIIHNLSQQNWFDKECWNNFGTTFRKPKSVFGTLLETSTFLNSIKKFSQDQESALQSWKQAKLFYRSNFTFTNNRNDEQYDLNHHNFSITKSFIKVDKLKPLIKPQDCKSISSVLRKLQIIKQQFNSDFTYDGLKEINFNFDVYLPCNKSFKKSSPPLPNYFLIIWNSTSSLPHPAELDFIRSKVPTSTKVLFAIISFDSIFFLEMENIQLPILDENCKS